MTAGVLIIDEAPPAAALAGALRARGLDVSVCATAEDGCRTLDRRRFEVLVLADRLPDADGFELCRLVRARSPIPIIMLTAAGDATGRILALEFGADDCLSRPAACGEVLARIWAVRRRCRPSDAPASGVLEFSRMRIEPAVGIVVVDGVARYPTPDQFALLLALARNAGRVVSRDELLKTTRADGSGAAGLPARSIDVHICRLRSLIEVDPRRPRRLLTVRGVGYVLTGTDDAS